MRFGGILISAFLTLHVSTLAANDVPVEQPEAQSDPACEEVLSKPVSRRGALSVVLAMLAGGWIASLTPDLSQKEEFDSLTPGEGLGAGPQQEGLFASGKNEVTFRILDEQEKTPILYFFTGEENSGTAYSINSVRGTPDEGKGVKTVFEGIRFVRSNENANVLKARLVGIKNEIWLEQPFYYDDLVGGNELVLNFGPTTIGIGISGTFTATMKIRYDVKQKKFFMPQISGTFKWAYLVGENKDGGSISNLTAVQDVEGKVKPRNILNP